MRLSFAQETIYDDICRWAKRPFSPAEQVKAMTGYAGSGKTTVAAALQHAGLGLVLYAAYTGKAASVLGRKGCQGASTIHSLIYRPKQGKAKCACPRNPYAFSDDVTHVIGCPGSRPAFELSSESLLAEADLLVVDECSMVSEDVARDLLSYRKRVLVVGDPMQLPPVAPGKAPFAEMRPTWHIAEIHRQAAESGVLRYATDVRMGNPTQQQYGDDVEIVSIDALRDMVPQCVMYFDQVICGTNQRRVALNRAVRQVRGLEGELPTTGDRVICLRNSRERGLVNGIQNDVIAPSIDGRSLGSASCVLHLDDGETYVAHAHHFLGKGDELRTMAWREVKKKQEFDFGWAITCHKAQGSEWDRVMVFDDSNVFRRDARRWLYTAATRAGKQLLVVQ